MDDFRAVETTLSAFAIRFCNPLLQSAFAIRICFGLNSKHDLEGYFESPAEQGFQNNPFFRSSTKKWGLAPSSEAPTFQVVSKDGMNLNLGSSTPGSSSSLKMTNASVSSGVQGVWSSGVFTIDGYIYLVFHWWKNR